MKVKIYEDGKVIGEKYETVEVEETTQPNPYLLKFLAEHKLSEKLGNGKESGHSKYKDYIDNMTEEEKEALKNYGN